MLSWGHSVFHWRHRVWHDTWVAVHVPNFQKMKKLDTATLLKFFADVTSSWARPIRLNLKFKYAIENFRLFHSHTGDWSLLGPKTVKSSLRETVSLKRLCICIYYPQFPFTPFIQIKIFENLALKEKSVLESRFPICNTVLRIHFI